MQISLAEKPVEGFPIVVPTGPISAESLIELGRFVRESCKKHEVGGAIIDCQSIEGALSPAILHSATPAFTHEVGQTIKVAYVNPPPQWNPSVDQFSRNLAYNRGGLLELFDTLTDAVHWLQEN